MLNIHEICSAAYAVKVDGDSFSFAGANKAFVALTGNAPAFHPGLEPSDMFPRHGADELVLRYRSCVVTRQAISYVSEGATPDRSCVWRTTLFPVIDHDGAVTSIIGVCCPDEEDAGSRRLSLEDRASMAGDMIDGGFWVYEVADKLFETSRSLAELLAGPGHNTLNLAEYISFIHSEDFARAGLHDTEQDQSEVEYRVITFDGRMLWLRSQRRTLRGANGTPTRVVGHVVDVTRQKLAFDALRVEASTDALTSIKNRRAFDRLAAEAFRDCLTGGKPMGILLIDLDRFKPINDRYGHRSGDEMLRKVARRIGRFVRKSDCFARIGGDEFAILLRGSSTSLGEALATRLRHAFTKPFMLGANPVFVGISMGFGVVAAQDTTITEVFDRADRALYQMKRARPRKSA